MTRRPDWQMHFEAFVRDRQNRPFEWGSNDCALFAADCVEAITGQPVLPELRGYSTSREARFILSANGGLRGVATMVLGVEVLPAFAAPGDVVLVKMGRLGESLGVCNGTVAIGPGASGIETVDMVDAVAAWKV